jgi:hypothetical protein
MGLDPVIGSPISVDKSVGAATGANEMKMSFIQSVPEPAFIVKLCDPAGVNAALLSAMNTPLNPELMMRRVVPAPAVGVPNSSNPPHAIQQLSAIVVSVSVTLDACAGCLDPDASGNPVCDTPVYEAAAAIVSEVLFGVTTMLCVPVAGPISLQNDSLKFPAWSNISEPIIDRLTPLYVTDPLVMFSTAPTSTTTSNRRSDPVHVWAKV